MYLSKFTIENFRAIKSLTLEFNDGVNVIIGENNSGKSSIIDALRICLGYGNQLRDIGVKTTDFYVDKNDYKETKPNIEFHLHFQIHEGKNEERYFYEFIHQDENGSQEVRLHFRFFIENRDGREIVKWKVWGGTNEGPIINYDALQFFNYTFLDALRDATQKLKPYSQQNKLAQLFDNLIEYKNKDGEQITLTNEKKNELALKLEEWLKDKDDIHQNDWRYVIQEGLKNVSKHLNSSEIEQEKIPIDIGFSGYRYKDVVNNLQMRIPIFEDPGITESEQIYFTLNQNGLGQNNLIYAATVLGDLINQKSKGYYHALLIEEPEAHLHPQKQNTFFRYLNELKENGIQIFITSHSPTITAKTDLKNVTVLQKQKNDITALAIKDSGLSKENRKYLSKFLDVTKSQLFFAKGVILVEGISEALLLPVFAKILGYNLEKSGIEIVNVGGTAFEHFAKLFNCIEYSLNSKCSILSDNDRGLIQKDDFTDNFDGIDKDRSREIFKMLKDAGIISQHNRIITVHLENTDINDSEISSVESKLEIYKECFSDRACNVQKLENINLLVKLADYTFEYELMFAKECNFRIIKWLYKKMHPKTVFDLSQPKESIILDILEKIEQNKDKTELAYNLSLFLDDYNMKKGDKVKFIVPTYIEEAIKWVVNG